MNSQNPSRPFPSTYEEAMAFAILRAKGLSNMPVQSINTAFVQLCKEIKADKERRIKNGIWIEP